MNLKSRIERMEQRMEAKPRQRLIYIMPNLEEGEGEETPYNVKISPGVWAHAFGGSLTSEEIRKLREEFESQRNRHEPQT